MKLTNSKILIINLCVLSFLSACKKEPHKNPLLSKHPSEVKSWIWENKNADIDACSKYWADPKNARKSDLNNCKPVATNLAKEMNYQGFLENVSTQDINVPIIWREIHERILSDIQWQKEIAQKQAQMRKLLGQDK